MNNTEDFLEGYLEDQGKQRTPDALLCSGLLLSGALLTIYCLIGGPVALITTVCVLILGIGLGIVINLYQPRGMWSWMHGLILLMASIKQPVIQPAQ